MKIPEWMDVDRKVQAGVALNPVEQLIHSNEPAGGDDKRFRQEVSNAFDFVWCLATSSGGSEHG